MELCSFSTSQKFKSIRKVEDRSNSLKTTRPSRRTRPSKISKTTRPLKSSKTKKLKSIRKVEGRSNSPKTTRPSKSSKTKTSSKATTPSKSLKMKKIQVDPQSRRSDYKSEVSGRSGPEIETDLHLLQVRGLRLIGSGNSGKTYSQKRMLEFPSHTKPSLSLNKVIKVKC